MSVKSNRPLGRLVGAWVHMRMFFPKEDANLTLFVKFMKLTGIWFYRKGGSRLGRLVQNGRMALLVVTIFLWDWSLLRTDKTTLPRKPYTPLVLWANILHLMMVYLYTKAADIEVLTDTLKRLLRKRKSTSERQRFDSLTSHYWRYIIVYVSFQATFAVIAISLVSLLCDLVFALLTESEEPFYIPMSLEGFLPEEKKRSFVFYALSICNGLMIATPVVYYGALLGLLSGTLMYIHLELEVSKRKLLQWSNLKNDSRKERALLKEIVDDHNEILRVAQILKDLLGPCFAMGNISATCVIGFYFYLSKMALAEGEIAQMTSQLYLSFISSFNTFIPCYIGQLLYNEGQKYSDYIYKLQWYKSSPAKMKDLQMIMIAAARPLVIDFKTRMALNFATFAEIMNKAYSLFILLDSINQMDTD